MVSLGILSSPNSALKTRHSALAYSWLGATLLAALGGFWTQKAVAGEAARDEADLLLEKGAPTMALQKAQEAVEADPLGARNWTVLSRALAFSGQNPLPAATKAAQLQPTKAANWSNLAVVEPQSAAQLWKTAIERDPNNTGLLLERAKWYLSQNQKEAAYDDLEQILELWDAPYGRYPATPDWVELDFARATVLMAPHLWSSGQKNRLKIYLDRALADVARSRAHRAEQEKMLEAVGDTLRLEPLANLDELEADLKSWRARF